MVTVHIRTNPGEAASEAVAVAHGETWRVGQTATLDVVDSDERPVATFSSQAWLYVEET